MARCGGGRGQGLNYFIIIAITTLAIRGVTHGWGRPGHTLLHHHLERGEERKHGDSESQVTARFVVI